MDFLFAFLTDWLKTELIAAIMSSFGDIFNAVNQQVGEIAVNVGQNPEAWNNDIFDMVRGLSDTVIVPIAGIILTFVATYELIQLIVEKNNMKDVDAAVVFKWIFSATRSHTNTTLQE